jgi:hypothetical protein
MDKQPDIIKFAYKSLQEFEDESKGEKIPKWSALCNTCGLKITERRGTTSGFVRYVNLAGCNAVFILKGTITANILS